MGYMGYDGPKASKYDISTPDGRRAYAREILPGYAVQEAEADHSPKPAGRSPAQLAREVKVVPFASAFAVQVQLGAEFDEYFVERNVDSKRARHTARNLRRSLILSAWSLLLVDLNAILDEVEAEDPR